jgi:hypothetical protein
MLHRAISPICNWTGFVGSDDAFLIFRAQETQKSVLVKL